MCHRIVVKGKGLYKPQQLLQEFEALSSENKENLIGAGFRDVLKCIQVKKHGQSLNFFIILGGLSSKKNYLLCGWCEFFCDFVFIGSISIAWFHCTCYSSQARCMGICKSTCFSANDPCWVFAVQGRSYWWRVIFLFLFLVWIYKCLFSPKVWN